MTPTHLSRSKLRSLLAIVSALAFVLPSVALQSEPHATQPNASALQQASSGDSLTPTSHCPDCAVDCCQLECGCLAVSPGLVGAIEAYLTPHPSSPQDPTGAAEAVAAADLTPPAPPPRV